MSGRWLLAASFLLLAWLPSGCRRAPAAPRAEVQFHDVSRAAGIAFVHHNGARGKKYMPETVGSGCAFLDYNGDGWMDLLFINSTDWPGEGVGHGGGPSVVVRRGRRDGRRGPSGRRVGSP